jgi:hypothetical protein
MRHGHDGAILSMGFLFDPHGAQAHGRGMEANVTHGPDLFRRDAAGRTVLFDAAERGDLEEVRRIIYSLAGTGLSPQRLALIAIVDASGRTASDVAEQHGHHEIAALLRGEQARMEYYE